MKRFTATEKWDKPWFQELPAHLKCLWLLICDKADHAGVWEPNWKLASLLIGRPVSAADLVHFGQRVSMLKDGKLQILGFVEFQYGELSTDCRAHFPIFRLIEKHVQIGYSIGYPIILDTHQVLEKEKEGEEMQGERIRTPLPPKPNLARGTQEEIVAFCLSEGLLKSDGEAMFFKWEGNGWKVGGALIKNWRQTIRSWKAAGYMPSQKNNGTNAHKKPAESSRNVGTANEGKAHLYRGAAERTLNRRPVELQHPGRPATGENAGSEPSLPL